MSAVREVRPETRALHDAAVTAIRAHEAICTLGCNPERIGCQTGKRLLTAGDEAWWAAKNETLPPYPPVWKAGELTPGPR